MIVEASLLFGADAGQVVTTEFLLARRFKVMVERTLLTLGDTSTATIKIR